MDLKRAFRGHFDQTPSNREQPSKIEGYLASMRTVMLLPHSGVLGFPLYEDTENETAATHHLYSFAIEVWFAPMIHRRVVHSDPAHHGYRRTSQFG